MWDHVFVCEKGHYIPFDQLHPGVKVKTSFLAPTRAQGMVMSVCQAVCLCSTKCS